MNEYLQKIIEKTAVKRASLIESFVIQYLKDTGLQITEIELVERQEGMKTVWYLRKKGSSD